MEVDKTEIGKMLELKTGKIKAVNRARMETEVRDNLLVSTARVGAKSVNVLRDTGCSLVIVRSLLDKTNMTREVGHTI